MFWKKNDDIHRNIRLSSKTPKTNLINNAIKPKNLAKNNNQTFTDSQNAQRETEHNPNEINHQLRLARYRAKQLKALGINNNESINQISEVGDEAFSSSVSDIAKEIEDDQAKINLKANTTSEVPAEVIANFTEIPPKTTYRKLRKLAIILTLFFLFFSYFIDAWFWQVIRATKTYNLTKSDQPIVVIVRKDAIRKSGVTEEKHFQTLRNLLNSQARAIGFYGSLSQWLPISNDPIQFARLDQLLVRYPNVVISTPAKYSQDVSSISSSKIHQQNKIPLKKAEFSSLSEISIQEMPTKYNKALANINIGYILDNEYYYLNEYQKYPQIRLQDIATTQLIAKLNDQNNQNQINGTLAFPLMLSAVANYQKPQNIKSSSTIIGYTIKSENINLALNKRGKYAPAILFSKNYPQVVEWDKLIKTSKSKFSELFKDRTIIIGLDEKKVFLPQKLPENQITSLGIADLFNWKIDAQKLIAIPAVLWQANIFSSINAGIGVGVPNILVNNYLGLLIIFVICLLLWFRKNKKIKFFMILGFALIGGILQYSLAYTNISAIIYGLLMLPILVIVANHRNYHQQVFGLWHQYLLNQIGEENQKPKNNSTISLDEKDLSTITPLNQNAATENNDSQTVDQYFNNQKSIDGEQIKNNIFSSESSNNQDDITAVKPEVRQDDENIIAATDKNNEEVPIQEVEAILNNESPKSYQDEINPFVTSSTKIPGDEINHENDKISTSDDFQDKINWDEKHRIAQNIAKNIIESQPENENFLNSQIKKGVNTELFNKVLIEDIDNDQGQLKIGRYQVEKVLGKGSMGVVYLGLDPHINRKVAIKTVPLPSEETQGENEVIAKKFFREAQAAGRLTHPSIVTIYDAGLYDQNVYMAMEFLAGVDLANFVSKEKLLPLVTVLSIISRVAEALHFAHENGVIHRDIKPANIIFNNSENTVKVTDFGIAHIHDSNRAMTQVLVGSPNYMSPEHLTGESLDGRSDLFSLGVTLYVLCSGATPFYAENVSRLMYCIINEPQRDIKTFNPQIPDTVVEILTKALAKDREMRYTSGASMAQDLSFAYKKILKHY